MLFAGTLTIGPAPENAASIPPTAKQAACGPCFQLSTSKEFSQVRLHCENSDSGLIFSVGLRETAFPSWVVRATIIAPYSDCSITPCVAKARFPPRIRKPPRVLPRIAIHTRAIHQSEMVDLNVAPGGRVIVAHPVLEQTGLGLEPLAGEAQIDFGTA